MIEGCNRCSCDVSCYAGCTGGSIAALLVYNTDSAYCIVFSCEIIVQCCQFAKLGGRTVGLRINNSIHS